MVHHRKIDSHVYEIHYKDSKLPHKQTQPTSDLQLHPIKLRHLSRIAPGNDRTELVDTAGNYQ